MYHDYHTVSRCSIYYKYVFISQAHDAIAFENEHNNEYYFGMHVGRCGVWGAVV